MQVFSSVTPRSIAHELYYTVTQDKYKVNDIHHNVFGET